MNHPNINLPGPGTAVGIAIAVGFFSFGRVLEKIFSSAQTPVGMIWKVIWPFPVLIFLAMGLMFVIEKFSYQKEIKKLKTEANQQNTTQR